MSFFCRLCGPTKKQRAHKPARSPILEPKTSEPVKSDSDSYSQEQVTETESQSGGLRPFAVRALRDVKVPAVGSPGYCSDIDEDCDNEYLDEVSDLFEDEKIFEAYEVFQKWKKEKGEEEVMQFPVCRELQEEMNDVEKCMSIINDDEDWTIDSSSNSQITVKYKKLPGEKSVTIRVEGLMDAPILNICGLCYEVDLFETWVPLCKRSEKQAQLTRTKQIVRNRYAFSFPFVSDREVMVYGIGVNALNTKHRCIMAVGRSVEGTFKGIQLPEKTKGTERASVPICGATFSPSGDNKVYFRFVSSFDPKLKAMPYSMLNWFSRKFAKGLFKKFQKKANKFSGTEHERRQSDPDPLKRQFYDRIKESIRNFLPQDNF